MVLAEIEEPALEPLVEADPRLPPIDSIEAPEVDLSDLSDLQGTVELLREVGAID